MQDLRRITLVDDEPDIREIIRISLEHIGGFRVNICDSGYSALESAASFRPDIVLLDMMMPGMDGIETYGKLREIDEVRHKPIVFVTAKVQYHEVEQYRDLGASDVIAKPFDPIALPNHIYAIWENHFRQAFNA